jgi:hypothetical protein
MNVEAFSEIVSFIVSIDLLKLVLLFDLPLSGFIENFKAY